MLGHFDWKPIPHRLGSHFRVQVPILGWDVCSIQGRSVKYDYYVCTIHLDRYETNFYLSATYLGLHIDLFHTYLYTFARMMQDLLLDIKYCKPSLSPLSCMPSEMTMTVIVLIHVILIQQPPRGTYPIMVFADLSEVIVTKEAARQFTPSSADGKALCCGFHCLIQLDSKHICTKCICY